MRITGQHRNILSIEGEGRAVHMFGRTVTPTSNTPENYDKYSNVLVLRYYDNPTFTKSEVGNAFRKFLSTICGVNAQGS
jgi:hypothetical protein